MTTDSTTPTQDEIAAWRIRDLVDTYPDVLAVLAPLGIDLCCGGSHPLGEALDLHGIPREQPLRDVERIVARQPERA